LCVNWKEGRKEGREGGREGGREAGRQAEERSEEVNGIEFSKGPPHHRNTKPAR